MFYTIGQRQGLGIGGKKGGVEAPWYVAAKDLKHNSLIVVQEHDHALLLKPELHCSQLHWVAGKPPAESFRAKAKIRYRSADHACHVSRIGEDCFRVRFDQAQWAVTPGQSIVLYQDEVCLGGGVINT